MHIRKLPSGTTASLTRHRYCPARKRSRGQTLGSVRLDANPHAANCGARLRPGVELSESEERQLRDWLLRNGTYGKRDAHRLLDEALEAVYERLEAVWREIQTSGCSGPMRAFGPHWKQVRDKVDALQARLQGLGAVATKGREGSD
jgi:hypothetical protein